MNSYAERIGDINLPLIEGEYSMIPFDLNSLNGLPDQFALIANQMLSRVIHNGGTGFFTIHGKKLKANQTLRRGGPHTDGSCDGNLMAWGNGGWKIGQNGPSTETEFHKRLYNSETGGIILASNFESCLGWVGQYDGLPGVGGDCSGIALDDPFMLNRNSIYYGNNHFIHESIPVSEDVHRVFARITMPECHEYKGVRCDDH